MLKEKLLLLGLFWAPLCFGQKLVTTTPVVDQAFALAIRTVDNNTENKLLKAGGGYGGEWTRDISINAWNAVSLLRPEVAEYSLWSVTTDNRQKIGHQYWDQILWVIAAYRHYLINGDLPFLKEAYACSANSMKALENTAFDPQFGLFTGPSVFNDGIAGYEEPIYQKGISSTYVLDYPESKSIKCLSTNCIYYEAYISLAAMSDLMKDKQAAHYREKAKTLKANIRKHLFDETACRLNYLVDEHGQTHTQQEGLGNAFAILFGIVTPEEATRIIRQTYISPYGIPSVYPDFKRFSQEHPGRHNHMIWPFVNAFWADACHRANRPDQTYREFMNLADLAIHKGKNDFIEVYNPQTGEADGGWQTGIKWELKHHQTWSATGYLRMMLQDFMGMQPTPKGLILNPDFPFLSKIGFQQLQDVPYRRKTFSVIFEGKGEKPKSVLLNGKKVKQAVLTAELPDHSVITYRF